MKNEIEGNPRRQPQDIEDEAFYQRQEYQLSLQLHEAWRKTRIGIEGNQFPYS
jgi:hypothetical protein